MRVSPIGFAFNDRETVLEEAIKSTKITHNSPEGIAGAKAIAFAIYLAKIGKSKEDIIDLMKKNGHSSFDVEEEDGDESNTKDLRVSYDVSMMDFFFSDNMLMYMNFGVFVDENGNIEKVQDGIGEIKVQGKQGYKGIWEIRV